MAVTPQTIREMRYTSFFTRNAHGVPMQLPFYLVTLDGVQYYTEKPMCDVNAKGERLQGQFTDCVFLEANRPLPMASAQDKEVRPVWCYYGY
jgi:hypothetical protein